MNQSIDVMDFWRTIGNIVLELASKPDVMDIEKYVLVTGESMFFDILAAPPSIVHTEVINGEVKAYYMNPFSSMEILSHPTLNSVEGGAMVMHRENMEEILNKKRE